jgi:serine/threonine-protein kinase HipA
LNISDDDNRLDFDLAMEVIDFFQLSLLDAEKIKGEVIESVSQWKRVATEVGISRHEQTLMAPAFNIFCYLSELPFC